MYCFEALTERVTGVDQVEDEVGDDGGSGIEGGNGHEGVGYVGEALGEGEAEVKC